MEGLLTILTNAYRTINDNINYRTDIKMLLTYIESIIPRIEEFKTNNVEQEITINTFLNTFYKIKKRGVITRVIKSSNDYNKLMRRFNLINIVMSSENARQKQIQLTTLKNDIDGEIKLTNDDFDYDYELLDYDIEKLSNCLSDACEIQTEIESYYQLQDLSIDTPIEDRSLNENILRDKKCGIEQMISSFKNNMNEFIDIHIKIFRITSSWKINIKIIELAMHERFHRMNDPMRMSSYMKLINRNITIQTSDIIGVLKSNNNALIGKLNSEIKEERERNQRKFNNQLNRN
jgi:hypothetical protein